MSKIAIASLSSLPRSSPRVHTISGIVLNYEGQSDLTYVRSPDVSTRGMFVSTTRRFPEGAILNVKFRLALTGASISARGEVRYCLPGVGIGLEFTALDPESRQRIEREVVLNGNATARRSSRKRRKPPRTKSSASNKPKSKARR